MAKKKLKRVNPVDQKIIEKLQDQLSKKLKPVPEVDSFTKGYRVNQAGAVVGLGLWKYSGRTWGALLPGYKIAKMTMSLKKRGGPITHKRRRFCWA